MSAVPLNSCLLVVGPLSSFLSYLLFNLVLLKGEFALLFMQTLPLFLHDACKCVNAPVKGLTPHKGTPAEVFVREELVVRALAILTKLDFLHI